MVSCYSGQTNRSIVIGLCNRSLNLDDRGRLDGRGHDRLDGRGRDGLDGRGHDRLDGRGHDRLDGRGRGRVQRWNDCFPFNDGTISLTTVTTNDHDRSRASRKNPTNQIGDL